MVAPGQFLERPTLIPVTDSLILEAVSHRGVHRPGVLVLPPPPIEGSGMDHVIGAEVAFAVARAGHPTLRFNYRGVGASHGPLSKSPHDWLADARAALVQAMANTEGAHSLVVTIGASDAVALRLSENETLAGLVLISPSLVQPEDLLRRRPDWPVAVIVPEHDASPNRAQWAEALGSLDAALTVVPGATRAYQRNLPLVGKAVVALLQQVRQA
jgi:alpha/beta superfamily hydrolase